MLRRSRRPFALSATLVAGICANAIPTWGQVINEDLKVVANDGAAADWFGWSIALDNGIVAVGARRDDDKGSNSGSAYLFDAATGTQLFKLLASDGRANDDFGFSIAMDNGIVAVGARGDDDNGSGAGSAFLFDATTGLQLFKLLATDGALDDLFGYSIDIDSGIVAVGTTQDDDNGINSGSAYLFDAATGAQLFKLLPTDGAQGDVFGESIAIEGGLVVVGARKGDGNEADSGAAYLFDATTGLQTVKLVASDGDLSDNFGASVAIDNGIIAVGADQDEVNGHLAGSAYVFDAATGSQIAKLLPSDGTAGELFGQFIAIDGGVVAVTAPSDGDNGQNSGSAYLFDAASGAELTKLLPSDGETSDFFGESIAFDNGVIAVGAIDDDDAALNAGAAYLFSSGSCLTLMVDNLVAGDKAVFTIIGGTVGAKGVTVYGTKPGQTSVNNFAGYCATFGIQSVNQNKVIGGLNRTFDGNGEITFNLNIPSGVAGLAVLFQSAERGTCPDECMSNLIEATIQ